MEELKWNIQQNEVSIKEQRDKITESLGLLQKCIEAGQYHGYNGNLFTEGHVAEDLAKLSCLIARQRALQEALHMIEKGQRK